MQQWEYVKGSEKDFESAPDWATLATAEIGRTRKVAFFAEKHEIGARYTSIGSSRSDRITDATDFEKIHVIAERRPLTETVTTTEALITERGNRYGEFKDGAAIMQQLKQVMYNTPKWDSLKSSQKEALDMIQHKIGRILNGDPDYDDNWKDIAGYATLIVKELHNDQ